MKTRWIFRGTKTKASSDIGDLLYIFTLPDVSDTLYTTDFIVHLVDEFWSIHQLNIFLAVCLPFIFHFVATLYFFSAYLTHDPDGTTSAIKVISSIFIYVPAIYFEMFEA